MESTSQRVLETFFEPLRFVPTPLCAPPKRRLLTERVELPLLWNEQEPAVRI